MLVGQGMPHGEFHRAALEAGAEEHVLRAIASHPERFDIGQLGCAVWESLRCGGLEGEECEGRPAECEDEDLWGPLEIDEAMHGTRPFEKEEWDTLEDSCIEQALGLVKKAASIDPDCYLLFSIEELRNPPVQLTEEMIEQMKRDGEL